MKPVLYHNTRFVSFSSSVNYFSSFNRFSPTFPKTYQINSCVLELKLAPNWLYHWILFKNHHAAFSCEIKAEITTPKGNYNRLLDSHSTSISPWSYGLIVSCRVYKAGKTRPGFIKGGLRIKPQLAKRSPS